MTLDAGQRLLIHRGDLHCSRIMADPDSPHGGRCRRARRVRCSSSPPRRSGNTARPWLRIVTERGAPALETACGSLLNGRTDARAGRMLTPQP